MTAPNKAVNSDVFFARCAHYKCAGYGWRYEKSHRIKCQHYEINTGERNMSKLALTITILACATGCATSTATTEKLPIKVIAANFKYRLASKPLIQFPHRAQDATR